MPRGRSLPGERRSERNLVVEVVAPGSGHGGLPLARSGRPARTGRAKIAAAAFGIGRRAAAPCPVEHGQFRAEALEHDLGRIAVLAGLVLPLARLELALHVNFRPLLEV